MCAVDAPLAAGSELAAYSLSYGKANPDPN